MTILFLPLNGIGLGHISRTYAVAQHLRTRGEAPVLMVQGGYPEFYSENVPGLSIPTIYKAGPNERLLIAQEITRFARLSGTRTIVEDTHPSPISLPADLRRVLLVRPASMEYMRHLREIHRSTFVSFMVTDGPASPTWPYSESETKEIQDWENWNVVGPVYRTSGIDRAASIRARYGFDRDEKIYVFSMGGGGTQKNANDEISSFLGESVKIAHFLKRSDPSARLLFVKGPLFPTDIPIPSDFNEVGVEPDMPALLAAADGAVIRPGFNSTWECIAGNTPFVAIPGVTFMEPVSDRMQALRRCHLAAQDVSELLDPSWQRGFKTFSEGLLRRWSPEGSLERVSAEILKCTVPKIDSPRVPARVEFSSARPGAAFYLRIDDIVALDRNLLELLEFCGTRALCPSLEVIPYLTTLDETSLIGATDPDFQFEVSQHGYAHLPRMTLSGRKAEILGDRQSLDSVLKGRDIMMRRFPARFKGGFSAPYDSLPPDFADFWHMHNGRYVSLRQHRTMASNVAILSPFLDPWDWLNCAPVKRRVLLKEAKRSLDLHGHVGIAVRPWQFCYPAMRHRTFDIIDEILDLGCAPRPISNCALSRRES